MASKAGSARVKEKGLAGGVGPSPRVEGFCGTAAVGAAEGAPACPVDTDGPINAGSPDTGAPDDPGNANAVINSPCGWAMSELPPTAITTNCLPLFEEAYVMGLAKAAEGSNVRHNSTPVCTSTARKY